jgi:hypothetical protein
LLEHPGGAALAEHWPQFEEELLQAAAQSGMAREGELPLGREYANPVVRKRN